MNCYLIYDEFMKSKLIKYLIIISISIMSNCCSNSGKTSVLKNEITQVQLIYKNADTINLKKGFDFITGSDSKVFLRVFNDSLRSIVSNKNNLKNIVYTYRDSLMSSSIFYSYDLTNKLPKGFCFIKSRSNRPMVNIVNNEVVFIVGDTISLNEQISNNIMSINKIDVKLNRNLNKSLINIERILDGKFNGIDSVNYKNVNNELRTDYTTFIKCNISINKLSFRAYHDYLILGSNSKGNDLIYYFTSHRDNGTEILGKFFVNENLENVISHLSNPVIIEKKDDRFVLLKSNNYYFLFLIDEYKIIKSVSVLNENIPVKNIEHLLDLNSYFYKLKK